MIKKKIPIILCIIMLLSYSATVYAASYSYTYNFKHQLAVKGKQTATQGTATFSISTTTNGSSYNYFTIKQYKYKLVGTNPYVQSKSINCTKGAKGSASLSTTKGTAYTYEFWKPQASGYVIGSGTLSY